MMLQRARGKKQPQVEFRERNDEDNEPLALLKSSFEKLRSNLETERAPAAERAFYREIARLNGDTSITMKPNAGAKALNLNQALSKAVYGENSTPKSRRPRLPSRTRCGLEQVEGAG